MKIVIISGYYDPLTVGHLEYIKISKEFSEENGKLIVIVNNDNQAVLKKGKAFMECDDRILILKELRNVDEVIKSIDTDRTVCETLKLIREKYTTDEIWFANGGDAFNDKIPERPICEKLGIKLIDGFGDKIRSSSWLTGITANN
jgi:cytidyltransferase-like protein